LRRPIESTQYTSIDYTQTLTDHRVLASVGSVGDAYDNAMAESFVDSFKTELIADRVWRTRAQLELATVEWVGWFNNTRLHGSLGDLPPAEFEALHTASKAPTDPDPGNRSVATLLPRAGERLTTARIQPVALTTTQDDPDPVRPAGQAAADALPTSPSGLAALTVGTNPTTLP